MPPPLEDRYEKRKTKRYAIHGHNPCGSKLVRGFARAKFGAKDTFNKSVAWYHNRNV